MKVENYEEKFTEAHERMKKYEYSDEKYLIKAPIFPKDLVKEGLMLHHCVKSYIPRIVEGVTNIVFLRKVNEPDISFFTIEVSNEGYIEQIHGLCSRNANTEPDIAYFLKDWAKKCNLKFNNYNKV